MWNNYITNLVACCYPCMDPAPIGAIIIFKGDIINEKIVSFVLCLVMALSLSVTVLADSTIDHSKPYTDNEAVEIVRRNLLQASDNTIIVMSEHYDVVIREQPTTQSNSLGTLYLGDSVYIITYNVGWADGHYWAYVYAKGVLGYVANDLLG